MKFLAFPGRLNALLTTIARGCPRRSTTMRIAFLTFSALAALGLIAGRLATLDHTALLQHLIRIFG